MISLLRIAAATGLVALAACVTPPPPPPPPPPQHQVFSHGDLPNRAVLVRPEGMTDVVNLTVGVLTAIECPGGQPGQGRRRNGRSGATQVAPGTGATSIHARESPTTEVLATLQVHAGAVSSGPPVSFDVGAERRDGHLVFDVKRSGQGSLAPPTPGQPRFTLSIPIDDCIAPIQGRAPYLVRLPDPRSNRALGDAIPARTASPGSQVVEFDLDTLSGFVVAN